ncbi:hypothetical protein [Massilia pseudoviolaceinigra]|uniref:hypothetical protein n=1 Tax=Massilia pseudoviolaceinigra TaxID=3057165 RepID=UPI002796B27F|nr:hypothetical protein [Massilia sp. CCM 9206]MDQ1921529.1 hypothetical protein [Massilia sp. CCM 9206]
MKTALLPFALFLIAVGTVITTLADAVGASKGVIVAIFYAMATLGLLSTAVVRVLFRPGLPWKPRLIWFVGGVAVEFLSCHLISFAFPRVFGYEMMLTPLPWILVVLPAGVVVYYFEERARKRIHAPATAGQ